MEEEVGVMRGCIETLGMSQRRRRELSLNDRYTCQFSTTDGIG